jgi:nitrate reductase cytochrome c-type subunit
MTLFIRYLAGAVLAAVLSLPALSLAEEPENYEADARTAGGNPPTIPHKVRDDATSQDCLACHKEGLKGASRTSHPERLECTECHVPGAVKEKNMQKKAKGKK